MFSEHSLVLQDPEMAEVNVTVRNMVKEDVPKALDLWRETGMQEGTHCLYTWLTVDPECFKVAVTDDGKFHRLIYIYFYLSLNVVISAYSKETRRSDF